MTRKIWVFLTLSVVYFATRLHNLMALPIFNDEAFFIATIRQFVSSPLQNLFINFSDGKEPFFFWLYGLPIKFSPDALLGIRVFTVVLGFLTLIYFWKISQRLNLSPLFASLAFIVNPFLLFYQRIAMQETLLVFLLLAGSYYVLLRRQFLAGIFFGLAALTKTSAFAYLIFLFPFFLFKKNLVAFAVGLIIYLPVLFGLNAISAHNAGYAGLISLPQIIVNLKQTLLWTAGYIGWPMTLVGLPALLPAFLESFIAKIFFPRYFLFCIPLVILFAAWICKRWTWLFLLLLLPNIILSEFIIFDIAAAPLPFVERSQFLESWSAGYGVKEAADFLKSEKARSINVESGVAVVRYGLAYYYPDAKYLTDGTGDYFVYKMQQDIPTGKFLVLKFSYSQPGVREKLRIYQRL